MRWLEAEHDNYQRWNPRGRPWTDTIYSSGLSVFLDTRAEIGGTERKAVPVVVVLPAPSEIWRIGVLDGKSTATPHPQSLTEKRAQNRVSEKNKPRSLVLIVKINSSYPKLLPIVALKQRLALLRHRSYYDSN